MLLINEIFRMISALRGMVYLESKNIIHRDVAARNFLVRYHKIKTNWI